MSNPAFNALLANMKKVPAKKHKKPAGTPGAAVDAKKAALAPLAKGAAKAKGKVPPQFAKKGK